MSAGARRLVAPVLVAVLGLAAILGRAGLESSLWMDEVYTLQIVHLAPERIVDLTARDTHPPGYYLALKAWLAAARALGVEPGIRWARGLGAAVWLALFVAVWATTRRLAGSAAAGRAACAVGGAAVAAELAVELRGYGVVLAASVVAFLAAALAERAGEAARWRQAAGW